MILSGFEFVLGRFGARWNDLSNLTGVSTMYMYLPLRLRLCTRARDLIFLALVGENFGTFLTGPFLGGQAPPMCLTKSCAEAAGE